ncbi:hypothetical protein FLAG1_06892 [Fusarium langsethiae]|uniref:Uncharacterized protein n=1 Tax=Fusarium langsethiae TaxID=179993 RepID=A0A0N0V6B8_FUSLA|nr:hypothetical protein FLAG1_06892 [Fusarium langsethiae]GKU04290.1 unnamed protein product [Fusarium langsethiae]GKU19618.1 unnamed protein product [Fusarium langsethiae]
MSSQVFTESLDMAERLVPSTRTAPEEAESPGSSDTASTGTPKHETTQVNSQSVRDELLPSKSENENEKWLQVPTYTEYPFKKNVLYSIITVIAIGIASLISLCWLIAYIQTKSKNEHPYITAEIVGGGFSSTAAKLIDAAFSMLVAPAIIAIANWHMFKLARLSAVNEHRGRSSAISMKVLVEVANTDWGSFSPLKFWTFARSKRPRVICLGAIAVLSALSFALLSNAVAYQAGIMLEYFSTPRAVTIDRPDDQDPHIRITFEDTPPLFESYMIKYQAAFGMEESILSKGSLENANASIDANQSSGIDPIDGSYRLALSGMNCRLEKSNGRADIKVNGSHWTIIKDTLFNEHYDSRPNKPMSSLTSTLQIFDEGSVGRAPGLGGHLLRAALNITSEGDQPFWELQSLFEAFLRYETASRQALLDNSPVARRGWYQIQCDTDKYSITSIPWILLVGLLALGVACAITVGLSIDSRKVHSLRIGRMLDSIRLTADVGVALDKQVFEECSTWHCSRLNKCADGARFQYEADTRLDSNTGLYSIGIRLRQISRPHE